MENMELRGMWWLPEMEDAKECGTLFFDARSGLRLELIGSLQEKLWRTKSVIPIGPMQPYSRLLGITDKARQVTLLDCLPIHASSNMPGFGTEEVIASMAFIGDQFVSANTTFHATRVSFRYLADWVGVSGFRGGRLSHKGTVIKHRVPSSIQVPVDEADLAIRFSLTEKHGPSRHVSLNEAVEIEVQSGDALAFHEWSVSYITPLQNLLALCTTKPNPVDRWSVFVAASAKEPISVVFQQTAYPETGPEELYPDDMLFTLRDTGRGLTRVVRRWLADAHDLRGIRSLVFPTRETPSPFLEQRFLPFAQAAEAYHRLRMDHAIWNSNERRQRERFVRTAPPAFGQWLDEALRHGNRVSFRRRMRELIEFEAAVMTPLVTNTKEFADYVTDTRNYLTHRDEASKGMVAEGTKLFYLTQCLSTLLDACLLRELGFTKKRRTAFLQKNRRYQFFLSQIRSGEMGL